MRVVICGLAALALVTTGLSACGPSEAQQAEQAQAALDAHRDTARRELDELVESRLSTDDYMIYTGEMYRISKARELGLSDLATGQEIRDAQYDRERPQRAAELGLPTTATDEQIYQAREARLRTENHARRAEYLGVPTSTSDADLERLESQRRRERAARRMGLEASATWEAIEAAQDERERLRDAVALGLEPDASVQEIRQRRSERANTPEARARAVRFQQLFEARENKLRIQAQLTEATRVVNALERGLPASATVEDIHQYEIDRVRRTAAILVGLPEDSGWAEIYDATNYENRTFY